MNSAPSTRKLENQAKHKQMLHAIHQFQGKLDSLAIDDQLLNTEAYRQLCISNKKLFDTFKDLFDSIIAMKTLYEQSIMNNAWVSQYEDPNYHKRQHRKREQKIDADGYKKCPCGDWICEKQNNKKGKARFWKNAMVQHQQTEKCMSNRARLKWEAEKKVKLSKVIGVDTYLLLNSHIHRKVHHGAKYQEVQSKHVLSMLVLRRKIRKLG
jgi:hypothetical protein